MFQNANALQLALTAIREAKDTARTGPHTSGQRMEKVSRNEVQAQGYNEAFIKRNDIYLRNTNDYT